MATTVKTKSGVKGHQGRLQADYDSFQEFQHYDEEYRLAARLGFKSARECWDANPLTQGSTIPDDFCRVLEKQHLPATISVIVELQVDSDSPTPTWMIRAACEQAMLNIIEMGEKNGFSHDHADNLSIGLVSVEAAANNLELIP